ncbi:unnamed protein product [Lota lota]
MINSNCCASGEGLGRARGARRQRTPLLEDGGEPVGRENMQSEAARARDHAVSVGGRRWEIGLLASVSTFDPSAPQCGQKGQRVSVCLANEVFERDSGRTEDLSTLNPSSREKHET